MANFDQATAAGAGGFQMTNWSMVLAANQADTPAAHEALSRLCETYWYPVYAFIRRRGHEVEPAKDLTQEFFGRLIAKQYLRIADRERGRFRTFLLACVDHFLANEWKKERTLKRGGNYTLLPLDDFPVEEWYQAEPADELSPDKLLDRRWALTLLQGAMERLRAEYVGSGKGALFDALQGCLSGAKEAPATFADLGAHLGLSEGACRQAAFRMRVRYGELLREGVAQTVANPSELEAELRHLRTSLNGR